MELSREWRLGLDLSLRAPSVQQQGQVFLNSLLRTESDSYIDTKPA